MSGVNNNVERDLSIKKEDCSSIHQCHLSQHKCNSLLPPTPQQNVQEC